MGLEQIQRNFFMGWRVGPFCVSGSRILQMSEIPFGEELFARSLGRRGGVSALVTLEVLLGHVFGKRLEMCESPFSLTLCFP